MKYNLETIEGTNNFVEKELLEKYPEVKVISKKPTEINFEGEIKDINNFYGLLSALRISNEVGETINLFRRDWRKEFVPAGINPAVAYIMCMIAKIKENETILDPFCGGGTIPITAALYFKPAKVIASDISGKAIKITQINFKEAKISDEKYFTLRKGVRDLRFKKESIDKIISNLPFGIRAGTHNMNEQTYINFKKTTDSLLKKDGLLVLLTQEKELLRNIFADYKLLDEIKVNQGGLKPNIFVLKKI